MRCLQTPVRALVLVLAFALASEPAVGALGSGPSTKERVDVLEQDLRDALGHLAEARSRVDALEQQVRDLRGSLGLDQPGQRMTPADLAARLESVETDLRILFENQGEARQRLSVLSDKVDALFRQMATLQATMVPGPAPLPASGLASPEAATAETEDVEVRPVDRAAASAVESPFARPSAGEPSPAAAVEPAAPARPAAPPPGPMPDPEELYQAARADFGRGSHDLAESGFQEFLDTFPESDLADNALYWIGECRYSRGELERALEAFDGVVTRWPAADKAPDAAYKKGLALLDLSRTAEGIVQLQKVKDTWPDTPAGRLARGKLQSLGLL